MNIHSVVSPRPVFKVRSDSQHRIGHGPAENGPNTAQSSGHDQGLVAKQIESTTGSEKTQAAKTVPNSTEFQQLEKLKSRDREVRAHETAHKATAGPYSVGAPSFQFVTGPDGKQYAVGGEVQIDTAEIPNDPLATLTKAQTIRRAANAPVHPSGQDRSVAAQAARMESKARQELSEQRAEQNSIIKNYQANSQQNQEDQSEIHVIV